MKKNANVNLIMGKRISKQTMSTPVKYVSVREGADLFLGQYRDLFNKVYYTGYPEILMSSNLKRKYYRKFLEESKRNGFLWQYGYMRSIRKPRVNLLEVPLAIIDIFNLWFFTSELINDEYIKVHLFNPERVKTKLDYVDFILDYEKMIESSSRLTLTNNSIRDAFDEICLIKELKYIFESSDMENDIKSNLKSLKMIQNNGDCELRLWLLRNPIFLREVSGGLFDYTQVNNIFEQFDFSINRSKMQLDELIRNM